NNPRVRLRRDANDAPASAVRSRNVQISLAVKRQPLRTSEPAKERADFAALRDAVDAVIAGSRRPGHIQIAVRMKREVICGERRLDSGKHKNFAACTDFENCPASVADIK